ALLGVVELHLASWHLDPIPHLVVVVGRFSDPGRVRTGVPAASTRKAAGAGPATLHAIASRPAAASGLLSGGEGHGRDRQDVVGWARLADGAAQRRARRDGSAPAQRRRSGGISRVGASAGTGSRPSPARTCSRIIVVEPQTKASSGS